MARFPWVRPEGNAAWIADMGDNITLCVSPEQTRGFMGDPKRGTRWRFQASHWDAAKSTSSVWGRDAWRETTATRAEAMREAEKIYTEEIDRLSRLT